MGNRNKASFGGGIGQVTSSYSAPNLTGVVYDTGGNPALGATVKIWKSTTTPVNTAGAANFTVTSSLTDGSYSQNMAFTAGLGYYWAVQATFASTVVTSGGYVSPFQPVHFDGTAVAKVVAPIWKTADTALYTVSTVSSGAVTAMTVNTNAYYEPGIVQSMSRTSGAGSGATITAVAGPDGILDVNDYTISNGGASHTVGAVYTPTRKCQRFVLGWSGKINSGFSGGDFVMGVGGLAAQMTGGQTVRISCSGIFTVSFSLPSNYQTAHNEWQATIDLSQATGPAGVVIVLNGSVITPTYTLWNQGLSIDVGANTANIGVGCNTAGAVPLEHELDYLYIAPGYSAIDNTTGQLLDLTQPANVARFNYAQINQLDGTGPTGRQPLLFVTGPYTSMQSGSTLVNLGRGNNGTVTGTLTAGT